MKRHILCIAVLSALAVSACSPVVVTRGNLISDTKFAQVEAEKSTRADVTRIWGPPTMVSSFDNSTWYYMGETTAQKGIFEPKVESRRMIRVRFADNDAVAEIEELDPAQARNIQIVERTTPNAGKEYTALQQFIGNLGKYNTNK